MLKHTHTLYILRYARIARRAILLLEDKLVLLLLLEFGIVHSNVTNVKCSAQGTHSGLICSKAKEICLSHGAIENKFWMC